MHGWRLSDCKRHLPLGKYQEHPPGIIHPQVAILEKRSSQQGLADIKLETELTLKIWMGDWPVCEKNVKHQTKLPSPTRHQQLLAIPMASSGSKQLPDLTNVDRQLPRPPIMIRSHNALRGAPSHSLKMILGASTTT